MRYYIWDSKTSYIRFILSKDYLHIILARVDKNIKKKFQLSLPWIIDRKSLDKINGCIMLAKEILHYSAKQ